MKFHGTWHIQSMDLWDEDFLNMETQAYIEIKSNKTGSFQFGLVSGNIDGDVTKVNGQEIYMFSWEGNDECDHAFGSGWCSLQDGKTMNGEISFHRGDCSGFQATRASQ